jgi:CNT family concentrative nucleoside transporter
MPTPAILFAEATAVGLADRLRGLLGIVVILGLVIAFSEHRRAISRRVLFWGLALQWGFAFIVLKWSWGALAIKKTGDFVQGILDSALAGSKFVFGEKLLDPGGPAGFVFAFRILPTVIFVAAFFAVLYHLGIMQWVVRGVAIVMARLFGASGAESLDVAASIFIGQTEAPLTIRPYLPKMTDPSC